MLSTTTVRFLILAFIVIVVKGEVSSSCAITDGEYFISPAAFQDYYWTNGIGLSKKIKLRKNTNTAIAFQLTTVNSTTHAFTLQMRTSAKRQPWAAKAIQAGSFLTVKLQASSEFFAYSSNIHYLAQLDTSENPPTFIAYGRNRNCQFISIELQDPEDSNLSFWAHFRSYAKQWSTTLRFHQQEPLYDRQYFVLSPI